MLIFVVPLQGPGSTKNWSLVSKLAVRSIRSLLQQTSVDYRVILVCNEPPSGLPDHPALTLIQRDFPVPDMSIWENRMTDKWKRVRVGLVVAQALTPCHIMVVDADDCVSNRLAAHVNANPLTTGWYFNRGWMHDEGSRLIYRRRRDFDAICGTSSIVRVTRSDLPEREMGERDDNLILRSGHTKIRANMILQGTPLEKLPFIGAVYNLATGENHTSFSLAGWRSKRIFVEKLLNYRPLTRSIREEFGLYDTTIK